MSRYNISQQRYDIVVGWDRPMQTFFFQVFLKPDNQFPDGPEAYEDMRNMLADGGAQPKCIEDVKSLVDLLGQLDIDISGEEQVIHSLIKDQVESGPPSDLQRSVAALFGYTI